MAGEANDLETAIAALGPEGPAGLAGRDAPLLLFSRSADWLLWSSLAAAGWREALTLDDAGQVDPATPDFPRLRALAEGRAPQRGARLERLRLDRHGLAPATMVACRLMTLPDGREALLAAMMGPAPARMRRSGIGAPPPSVEGEDSRPQHAAEAAQPRRGEGETRPQPDEPAGARSSGDTARDRPSGTVRFLWQTDAAGRFLFAPEGLAELVGSENADLAGRRFDELTGTVDDPTGEVARCFARHEAWSSRPVLWRIGRTGDAIPVDFAGTPMVGRDRQVTGFRGFGLARSHAVASWPRSDAPPAPLMGDRDGAAIDRSQFVDATGSGDVASVGGPAQEPHEQDRSAAPVIPSTEATGRLGPDRRRSPPTRSLARGGGLSDQGAAAAAAPPTGPAPDAATRSDAPNLSRLSNAERSAFREIARALGARFATEFPAPSETTPAPAAPSEASRIPNVTALRPAPAVELDTMRVLERLPLGILIHRGDTPLFANRLLLDLADYSDVEHLGVDGGVGRLFRGRSATRARADDGGSALALTTRRSESVPVEVRVTTVEWDGLPASLMLVRQLPENDPAQRLRALELELRARESRVRELSSILDTATDGVLVLDEQGRILALNRSAEALFGYDQNEVAGETFTTLLASDSHVAALDYLDGLAANGVASLLNDGREVLGRVRQDGLIPLFMTMGRIAEAPERKFCAVLRDVTAFKKAEGELLSAKRAAEEASAQRSDFLAKVSHEVRTPLNAIIGFAEVMLEERFGAIGNERYRDYIQDIHASGLHVVNLLSGLLDLAKIGAGRLELAFTGVNLNGLVAKCVAELQPQAARQRIVMRTSYAAKLPPVVADERSIRQIMLNIVSNAIKFTEAGGQVIVSTAMTDRGEVAFRVRDTGVGMTKEEVEAALEPFRQTSGPRKGGGTGLGLPLTKALVGANRGALLITSARNEGTLVEVLFPPTRVLAE